MYSDGKLWVARGERDLYLLPAMANRHGLIAGATGTGKTVTMKVLAESFSDMGVPVFLADVKGDLSGFLCPGLETEDLSRRLAAFGLEDSFAYTAYPTRFWDIFGERGTPVRVTVSEMGPTLLSRLLGLTEVQAGVMSIVFKAADEAGLLLLDLKDLRSMLQYVGDNRKEYTTLYGMVSTASVGAIQRALLRFEEEGAEAFFGEPMLEIRDWMRTGPGGRGVINVLSSQRLIQSPTVYATFLLWMMTELFEKLPEVGDLEKPRMVFFFDEAHLLFADAPKALVQKIVQVVKQIRSKGVGVYFVTQSPSDLPDEVLAQLSNRIQHALRAYTPAEQKAVRAAARGFRANPRLDAEQALQELGVGEALVSFLDGEGVPEMVERARILPPQSLIGPAAESLVQRQVLADEFDLKYRESVDRESAYEVLQRANEELRRLQEQAALEAAEEKRRAREDAVADKAAQREAAQRKKALERAAHSASSTVMRAVSTNVVNSLTGGKTTDMKTVARRAATNALSSVMRSGSSSIIRGLFGNMK